MQMYLYVRDGVPLFGGMVFFCRGIRGCLLCFYFNTHTTIQFAIKDKTTIGRLSYKG